MLVSLTWANLLNTASSAHLHAGRSGAAGPVVCDLSPPALTIGLISDRLCVLTPAQAAALRAGQFSVDIHTSAFPGGEIRGQIKRSFNPCDFDGDGRSDPAIARTNGVNAFWCDGRDDYTIYREGAQSQYWTLRSSDGGVTLQNWGVTNDFPHSVPDYDGDGRTDLANSRRLNGQRQWWVRSSLTGGPLPGASGALFGSGASPGAVRVNRGLQR